MKLNSPPAAPGVRPILITDCTLTYRHPAQTGIQRVVRNALRHARDVAPAYGYDVLPVALTAGQFRVADVDRVLRDRLSEPGVEMPSELHRLRQAAASLLPRESTEQLLQAVLGPKAEGSRAA